jgi:uncharacterized protein GlcG (DUF336 family)
MAILMRKISRTLRMENLERRELLAVAAGTSLHNAVLPADVNNDLLVTPLDALVVLNTIGRQQTGEAEAQLAGATPAQFPDVNNDGEVTPLDALKVLHHLAGHAGEEIVAEMAAIAKAPGVGTTYVASLNAAETANAVENLLTSQDVETLLNRASMASSSQDAIIAIVDRSGRILGVRVEAGVDAVLQNDPVRLAFAIDGAVAKARTAAFFSNNEAPLTSRTIRFISQSTVTQREVESFSMAEDDRYVGPGFVAPIGVGGKFPPMINFTPQVDLFAIEHQSRDRQVIDAGPDGKRGTADDVSLQHRFNANPAFTPELADQFFKTWPESYGAITGTAADLQSRGIATLPGGVPLYKTVVDKNGNRVTAPLSQSINLVGGIGVFFPGPNGFATHEQDFVHASARGGIAQSDNQRLGAAKVIEAEFIALAAAAGAGIEGPSAFVRDISDINAKLPPAPRFVALNARIDLVGITLQIYGPTPNQANPNPGIDQVLAAGRARGTGVNSGANRVVDQGGSVTLAGQAVPQGWLVAPHDSAQPGGLTAADVEAIIVRGVAAAEQTRAAIRLNVDNNFKPGARTSMVLAVADTNGELLGLFRMNDATVFSIDVAVAKARNTAYYADPNDLIDVDRIDFNGDGNFGRVSTSLNIPGDTVPLGTALTNRTFRFIVTPRFPTGSELPGNAGDGLINDANVFLRDRKPSIAAAVGPESILQMPGINPLTAENIDRNHPLPAAVYAGPDRATFVSFASFVPGRNFRDPGDAEVIIHGTAKAHPVANQNGVVFFPGSTPLYRGSDASRLIGGFGVSGDGVDQDDVVTASGQIGFDPPQSIRADTYTIANIRLPFQKFNRNPLGA